MQLSVACRCFPAFPDLWAHYFIFKAGNIGPSHSHAALSLPCLSLHLERVMWLPGLTLILQDNHLVINLISGGNLNFTVPVTQWFCGFQGQGVRHTLSKQGPVEMKIHVSWSIALGGTFVPEWGGYVYFFTLYNVKWKKNLTQYQSFKKSRRINKKDFHQ